MVRSSFITVVTFILLGSLSSCNCMPVNGESIHDHKVTDPAADTEAFLKIGHMTFIKTNISGSSVRERRNAVLNNERLWPGAVIPYEISPVFSEAKRKIILRAMKHWEDHTCIRFRPKNDSDVYAISYITSTEFCQSFVGRIHKSYQPQGIHLSSGCTVFYIVLHMIGHAIGFYEEHQRFDRDQYVTVLYQNIINGYENLFDKFEEGNADTLGFGYDYASIMHFKSYEISKNYRDTIVSRQPGIPLGGDELSPLDIAKTDVLYNCGPHDTHPPPSTIVPDAPAITLPPGVTCGSVVEVTGLGNGTFTFPNLTSTGSPQTCALVLHAPKGYEYEFSFPDFPLSSSTGCNREFVQIFRGSSTSPNKLINYFSTSNQGRLCGDIISRYRFSFRLNRLTIYLETDGSIARSGVTVSYSVVDQNECDIWYIASGCHSCTNTPGSYECDCNSGYYHSFASTTCFDVNECAINNGGCEQTCTNLGGGYRCSCEDDLFVQDDGLSCGSNMTASSPATPSPGTSIPKMRTSSPATPATVNQY